MSRNSGVIVAALPNDEYVRTRPTIDDHHLTVAALGRVGDEDITEKAVRAFWKGLTKTWTTAIGAQVTAEAMFDTPDGWAHVDLIDAPLLPSLRAMTEEMLQMYGLPLDMKHGFLPHITRRYLPTLGRPQVELVQRKGKLQFMFDRLAIWHGDTRLEMDLQ